MFIHRVCPSNFDGIGVLLCLEEQGNDCEDSYDGHLGQVWNENGGLVSVTMFCNLTTWRSRGFVLQAFIGGIGGLRTKSFTVLALDFEKAN